MITLTLSDQEAQIILAALANLTIRDGLNTFISVKNQIENIKKETDV